MKPGLIGWTVVLSLSALAGLTRPALASPQVGVNVVIAVPPPPVPVQVVPAAQPGRIWVPGYWDWNGYQHVWMEGHWEHVRAGYVYEPPVWVQAGNGWKLKHNGWRAKGHPHGCPPGQAKKGNC